jgi:hypothetical protein
MHVRCLPRCLPRRVVRTGDRPVRLEPLAYDRPRHPGQVVPERRRDLRERPRIHHADIDRAAAAVWVAMSVRVCSNSATADRVRGRADGPYS